MLEILDGKASQQPYSVRLCEQCHAQMRLSNRFQGSPFWVELCGHVRTFRLVLWQAPSDYV